MAFNSASFAHVSVFGGTYYHAYSHPTDTKGNIKSSGYFPPALVRPGDLVVVEASDGDMVVLVDDSHTPQEIVAY